MRRPAAPGYAALAIAAAAPAIVTDVDGGDPLRPASPRWRSPLTSMVATRCARRRRAGDRH
ncbi:hypothetical protein [Mycobacterium sp. 852002-10029_SCH5224772]|uniref:hypothetical protein n=1 Tax=Mycobacterium sp. 852002-10029_SCH5224772 TaxID=1834083 RepID=UPI0007FC32F7|nr:hypothetical protein [Mycobacterium sp. 852002-10029_SCH5224772]OBE92377.1 hypothetical protein A5775_13470 [Mycobacterium sp. 852002-10029_SCH5224772]